MLNRFRLSRKWIIVLRFVLPLHAILFFLATSLMLLEVLMASEADGYRRTWWDYFYSLIFRAGIFELGLVFAPFVAYRGAVIKFVVAGTMAWSFTWMATGLTLDFSLDVLGWLLGIQNIIKHFYFGPISLWRILIYLIAFLCLIPKTELR